MSNLMDICLCQTLSLRANSKVPALPNKPFFSILPDHDNDVNRFCFVWVILHFLPSYTFASISVFPKKFVSFNVLFFSVTIIIPTDHKNHYYFCTRIWGKISLELRGMVAMVYEAASLATLLLFLGFSSPFQGLAAGAPFPVTFPSLSPSPSL